LIKSGYHRTMRGAANLTSAMEVAADLRQRILVGELRPGTRLKIDDIAEMCDVSHMPVRVALQSLEAEGVLDVYPHRGAVIKAVDARFVRHIVEVRAAIEVMLTEKCARLIDKDGLAELETLAVDFEHAAARKDARDIVTANLRLHDAIGRTADNPEARRVLARGRLLIQALRVRYGFGPGRVDQVIAEHRALVKAIARKDERRAGENARRHCEGARDELLGLLDAK
jgi:DNA-binding GntR family transcriptional regulator